MIFTKAENLRVQGKIFNEIDFPKDRKLISVKNHYFVPNFGLNRNKIALKASVHVTLHKIIDE